MNFIEKIIGASAAAVVLTALVALPGLKSTGAPLAAPAAAAEGGGLILLDDEESSADSEEAEGEEKVFPEDKGPNTIDVSGYPKEMQKIYQGVFSVKCSKCHTLARPINSRFALPEEWNPYVEKMRKKRRSGIGKKDAEKIKEFLNFDSKIRKKKLIEEKLEKIKSGGGGDSAPDHKVQEEE